MLYIRVESSRKIEPRFDLETKNIYSYEPVIDVSSLLIAQNMSMWKEPGLVYCCGSGIELNMYKKNWHYTPRIKYPRTQYHPGLTELQKLKIKYDLAVSIVACMRYSYENSGIFDARFGNITNEEMANYLVFKHGYTKIYRGDGDYEVFLSLRYCPQKEQYCLARARFLAGRILSEKSIQEQAPQGSDRYPVFGDELLKK